MKLSQKLAAFAAALLTAIAGTASAELSAEIEPAFDTLRNDGLALIDLAWPVVVAITIGFIIMGLFKKAANKAV